MFNSPGIDNILPYGSAPTIWISGFFDLIFLAIPAMVPPVPTPIMTASIFPEVWSNIYSPNWSKWAIGLDGLEYWSKRTAPSF